MGVRGIKLIGLFGAALLTAVNLAYVSFAAAGAATIKIRVIDHDSGRGVKSDVFLKKPDGREEHLVDTGDDGVKQTAYSCHSGEQILARPLDVSYYQSDLSDCATLVILKVIWKPSLGKLQKAAQQAEEAKDYAGAALFYNELEARVRPVDSEKARSYEQRVYENLGKALNAENSVVHDSSQGRDVMSPSLRQQVYAFQKKSQLPESGQIDYATLSKLSGENVGGTLASKH